jgi:hypothetical protein
MTTPPPNDRIGYGQSPGWVGTSLRNRDRSPSTIQHRPARVLDTAVGRRRQREPDARSPASSRRRTAGSAGTVVTVVGTGVGSAAGTDVGVTDVAVGAVESVVVVAGAGG